MTLLSYFLRNMLICNYLSINWLTYFTIKI